MGSITKPEGSSGVSTSTSTLRAPPDKKNIAVEKVPDESGNENAGGCPMKRADGSYSYDWKALFKRHPHGLSGSKPLNREDLTQSSDGYIQDLANEPSVTCPVKSGITQPDYGGGCPVEHKEYNVYSQRINPTNQMPQIANQLPAPGQNEELSVQRVASSIAKGGANEGATWTYPSPQMFFNALARKGKLTDTKEEDMESLVAVHNNMNEKTWAKVLEWEEVLCPDSTPKLLKFMGRPADLSPKATLKHYLFGHPLPYDRHDWTILRSDGTTVRYVIDYYHDESRADETPESELPELKDHRATPSLLVDVRPAVDSLTNAWNRAVTMPYAQTIAKTTNFEFLPLAPTPEMKSQLHESLEVWSKIQETARQRKKKDIMRFIPENEAVALATSFAQILKDCQDASYKMRRSQTEEEHQRASLDLTICMAKIVCPLQHKTLVKALVSGDEDIVEAALDRVTSCVVANTSRRSAAKAKFPYLFDKKQQ